ncbi:hypothetical protein [Fictibacillus sp. KU28468]|uniref:hypothetical protein n=1 Tax=Fictibacillus sp. KU28468 TaxID=2991053 RepID=UPI00223D7DF3|nr:hypothetical protein [Fictibacillus sp. KU28468]UZJ79699.1 hypothetical protein OKX00_04255 [Fictibacillus sp. KU28468]
MFFDKQKYRMQAEMLDWYSGKVTESMHKLDRLGRDRAHVLTKAQDWESKSKASYKQIMSEAASTHFSSASTGEQLKDALKREATRLREKANDIERQEKLDESNKR